MMDLEGHVRPRVAGKSLKVTLLEKSRFDITLYTCLDLPPIKLSFWVGHSTCCSCIAYVAGPLTMKSIGSKG